MGKYQKLTVTAVATIALCYFLVCVFFYFSQVFIIFGPTSTQQNVEANFPFTFEERYFETAPGVQIHAIHAKADSAKGLVIYMRGNRGSNLRNAAIYDLFLEQNYDVLYPDYRQHGKSTGKLWNEDDLMHDFQFIYSQMLQEYSEDNITLVGYSLGSGIATQIAADNRPEKLILIAPFYSILDVKNSHYSFLPDFLVRFPFRNDVALQQIEEPVFIFYAENDEVLPVENSFKLTSFLKDDDGYFILKGQGHNGLFSDATFKQTIEELLDDERN